MIEIILILLLLLAIGWLFEGLGAPMESFTVLRATLARSAEARRTLARSARARRN